MTSETDRALARLHLDLAHAMYARREALNLSVEQVAMAAGLAAERVVAIEEGDTSSLTEVARLCHALDAGLRVNPDFGVQLTTWRETTLSWIKAPSETTAKSQGLAHPSMVTFPSSRDHFHPPATVGSRGSVDARH